MTIEIDKLSYEELIDLNHRIVERLKLLDQMKVHEHMTQFNIGDRVRFNPREGSTIKGFIEKCNRKTVSVISDDGQRWRVSPELLSKDDAQGGKNANVISIYDSQRRGTRKRTD